MNFLKYYLINTAIAFVIFLIIGFITGVPFLSMTQDQWVEFFCMGWFAGWFFKTLFSGGSTGLKDSVDNIKELTEKK